MSVEFGFERVYVELDRYDGPRSGIADVYGVPHRFLSNFDESDTDPSGTFLVFPIDSDMLALEIEQWRIFVSWNKRYEAGEENLSPHPGTGGVDARWDELEMLLTESRQRTPSDARSANAAFSWLDREERYAEDGPDYCVRWTLR
ncbi:MAG: hypothetical protein IT473_08140 [Lysobacter sp.]|nr:hypothetical protein [Lysobacter sp.]